METHRNTQDFVDDDLQATNQPISLAEYSQTHPYQYLKQLNNVYQSCNKSSGKDYSTASMVKLPWKKFKPVAIPKCFQESYNMERKQTCVLKNSDENDKSEEVEKQRKFWKEHEELMKKYYRSNIVNGTIKKQKMEERRKNLFSAKSCISINNNKSSQSCSAKNGVMQSHSFKPSQNRQNHEQRFHTLKTQSDQTQSSGLAESKGFINSNSKEKHFSSTNLFRDTTNTNSFLKKRSHRSKCFNEQMTVQEQVLLKLKKISMMPHLNRAKTANMLSRQGKCYREREKLEASFKKTGQGESLRESRVKQGEYLEFSVKEELIARYKNKIKEIDCSISEKNVKRTADILKEMQQLASVDIDDY